MYTTLQYIMSLPSVQQLRTGVKYMPHIDSIIKTKKPATK